MLRAVVARRRGRILVAAAGVWIGAIGVAACGGGAGGASTPTTPASIVHAALACGDTRYAYDQTLAAQGGSGSYAWSLVPTGGTPPPGIQLGFDGRLTGKPTADGTFAFEAHLVDVIHPNDTDAQLFSISVGVLRIDLETPHWGDAWAGEACMLRAPLETVPVTYSFLWNGSGASLVAPPFPSPDTTYIPGPVPARDYVRCRKTNGLFVDVQIDTLPALFGNRTARFGVSDVWYVDFDQRLDTMGFYACDFDAALAAMGLRGATSRDAKGTVADQIARTAAIEGTHRWVNQLYLNNADGSPASGGLAISFPMVEPGAPYTRPAAGTQVAGAPGMYNVIALDGRAEPYAYGAGGLAFGVDAGNGSIENMTTPTAGLPVGVILANWVPSFNTQYANTVLPSAPIGPGDEAALRAVLYSLPTPAGARAAEVVRILDGFARYMAVTVAHEIGHELGFNHMMSSTSIMSYSGWPGPPSASFMPAWTAAELAVLRVVLPGPGR